MNDVKSTVTSVSLTLIGWPIGIFLALQLVGWVSQLSELLIENMVLSVIGLILSPIIGLIVLRWAVPPEELEEPGTAIKIGRVLALIFCAALAILIFLLLAELMFVGGQVMMDILGPLSFIGYFIAQIGEIIRIVTLAGAVLAGAGVLRQRAGQTWAYTQRALSREYDQGHQPVAGRACRCCCFCYHRRRYRLAVSNQ